MNTKTTTCPLGGDCGGTGWVYVPARDVGEPEPAHYEPCRCNPGRLGDPWFGVGADDVRAERAPRPVVAARVDDVAPIPF